MSPAGHQPSWTSILLIQQDLKKTASFKVIAYSNKLVFSSPHLGHLMYREYSVPRPLLLLLLPASSPVTVLCHNWWNKPNYYQLKFIITHGGLTHAVHSVAGTCSSTIRKQCHCPKISTSHPSFLPHPPRNLATILSLFISTRKSHNWIIQNTAFFRLIQTSQNNLLSASHQPKFMES